MSKRRVWRVVIACAISVTAMSAVAKSLAGRADAKTGLLSGTVKNSSGEKMAGVTVSAKQGGSTITQTVFTDDDGEYFFPPEGKGKYDVWAQADAFETARGTVNLAPNGRQDFVMNPLDDFERQLTADQLVRSLPEDTEQDRRMKTIFQTNCTSCHQPNYILQNRFDANGWTAVIDLMRKVDVVGGYLGPDVDPYPIIDFHEKELAEYLAKARGPGPTSMKFKIRPRPSGEAARAVFTEYDVPLRPIPADLQKFASNDGSNWMLGTPSMLNGNRGIHDVQEDFNHNIWFSYNSPNPEVTIGRVDAVTGELKVFPIPGQNGLAAFGHGMVRDKAGNIWFNISPAPEGGSGRLAMVDPTTQKISVYTPPSGMDGPTTVAGTVDVDGKGKVWATTGPGAVRFDPDTKTFTQFRSITYDGKHGIGPFGGNTYGIAADVNGNGWWAQMAIDTIGRSDITSGKSSEVKIPPVPGRMDFATDAERKLYAASGSGWNSATPDAQGPRRLAADPSTPVIWVCDWYGGNLARIDAQTSKVTIVPLPEPAVQQPYQSVVDSKHHVWINMMNSDSVMEFNPDTSTWTEYPLPSIGTETRYISLLERNGSPEIVLGYSRSRRVARMTLRTKEELQELKAQAR
jgi:streptogramin lyase